MAFRSSPTYAEILITAYVTVDAFRKLGYRSCFFGSLACNLYGVPRIPNDVDVIVLNARLPQESLKVELARADPRFYLVRSKDPSATYRVVWFRLANGQSCKVDILQPGIMDIPSVGPKHIELVDFIPLMSLSVVLLLKLQGWTAHRAATEFRLHMKQHVDVADIDYLLPIAVRRGVKPREEPWIHETLIQASEERVREYVVHFPSSRERWRALGFDVLRVSPAVRQGRWVWTLVPDPASTNSHN